MSTPTKNVKATRCLTIGLLKAAAQGPGTPIPLTRNAFGDIPSDMNQVMDIWARASFLEGWLDAHGLSFDPFAESGRLTTLSKGLKVLRETYGVGQPAQKDPVTGEKYPPLEFFAKEWTSMKDTGFFDRVASVMFQHAAANTNRPEELIMDFITDFATEALEGKKSYFFSPFYNLGERYARVDLSNSSTLKQMASYAGQALDRKLRDYIKKNITRERVKQKDREEGYGDVYHLATYDFEDLFAILVGGAFAERFDYDKRIFDDDMMIQVLRRPAEELIDAIQEAWERELSPTNKRILDAIIKFYGDDDSLMTRDNDADIAELLWGKRELGTNVNRGRKKIVEVAINTMQSNPGTVEALDEAILTYMQHDPGANRPWVPTYGPEFRIASAQIELTARVAARAALKKVLAAFPSPDWWYGKDVQDPDPGLPFWERLEPGDYVDPSPGEVTPSPSQRDIPDIDWKELRALLLKEINQQVQRVGGRSGRYVADVPEKYFRVTETDNGYTLNIGIHTQPENWGRGLKVLPPLDSRNEKALVQAVHKAVEEVRDSLPGEVYFSLTRKTRSGEFPSFVLQGEIELGLESPGRQRRRYVR